MANEPNPADYRSFWQTMPVVDGKLDMDGVFDSLEERFVAIEGELATCRRLVSAIYARSPSAPSSGQ